MTVIVHCEFSGKEGEREESEDSGSQCGNSTAAMPQQAGPLQGVRGPRWSRGTVLGPIWRPQLFLPYKSQVPRPLALTKVRNESPVLSTRTDDDTIVSTDGRGGGSGKRCLGSDGGRQLPSCDHRNFLPTCVKKRRKEGRTEGGRFEVRRPSERATRLEEGSS